MDPYPPETHPELVRALSKPGLTILEEMNAGDAHLLHMAVGVAGEAGEIIDAVKKAVIYRKPLDLENLKEELGDMEFFLEGIRQCVGLSRMEILDANILKLSARYGAKYTNQAAIERKDKQL